MRVLKSHLRVVAGSQAAIDISLSSWIDITGCLYSQPKDELAIHNIRFARVLGEK